MLRPSPGNMQTTYQTDTGLIKQLILKHPREAFVSQAAVDSQWAALNYFGHPDLARANDEYDHFAALLEGFGIEIHFLPQADGTGMDSLYARDTSIACDKGMILCSMGKGARRGEPDAAAQAFHALDMPIHGAITGDGRVEGGDVTWLDEHTLAVGRGYRTNDEGIRQLTGLLRGLADVVVVPLPHYRGPDDVFHLMSFISPIDRDLALVYSPLMPIPFRELLLARGIQLVEVPDEEFESMGGNVLAVAPRTCVMLEGNPVTRARLESAGAEVYLFAGDEICQKGAGGPTCLTRPTLRVL